MKILDNNTRFYTGVTVEQKTEKTESGRVFAGSAGLRNPLDTQIGEKRAEAMEKAKKLLGNVFTAEKALDDDLAARADRIKESEQRIVDANKELKALREEQEKLKELYGVTGEETEEMLPEEYKMQREELERYGEPYRQTVKDATAVVETERKIIAAVQVERLKSDPMVSASKEAEGILEAAEKEIAGMVMEEAVEHVKEKAEEAKEKQETEKEKAELEEARRKEREERRKEADLSDIPVQELLSLEQVRGEVKLEVDTMLTEMKLLAEDIKGSMVDEEL